MAPSGSAITRAAGIPKLKEEKSQSGTLGFTLSPNANVAVTADLYRINIKDRIVLSGRFDADNYPTLGAALQALGVGQAQFFVNSVDTRTSGLDLTVSHKSRIGAARLNTYLAVNYSKTEVTSIKTPPTLRGFENVLLSERERLFIEQGGPRSKATLAFDVTSGAWNTDFKIIHFGRQTLGTFSGTAGGVPNAAYAPKTSADLSLTYSINKNTKLTFGGNNIFNVKPTTQNADETDNGFKYDCARKRQHRATERDSERDRKQTVRKSPFVRVDECRNREQHTNRRCRARDNRRAAHHRCKRDRRCACCEQ